MNGIRVENGDGEIGIRNPHLHKLKVDHLYHISLSTQHDDLPRMFGDVQFVCMGGQSGRMHRFAEMMAKELGHNQEQSKEHPFDYYNTSDRYSLFKVGPVLAVSHGIGIPSLSIVFQEVVKLLHHAGCRDVSFFRIGTSGGLGIERGTVVITEYAVNDMMKPVMHVHVLGTVVDRPAVVNKELNEQLMACAEGGDDFKTIRGTTMCVNGFYEAQARLDGAFCHYTEEEKFAFLNKLRDAGVNNIEMESLGFLAMCHRAGVKGAVMCVTLLDRLVDDEPSEDHELMQKLQTHPQILMARYIKRKLAGNGAIG